MLPKHKQGAPALEKVQTFLLFHPQMMVVMMTKVLGRRSCGVIVVLVWCATHNRCGALLTKASEREQILGQWREV